MSYPVLQRVPSLVPGHDRLHDAVLHVGVPVLVDGVDVEDWLADGGALKDVLGVRGLADFRKEKVEIYLKVILGHLSTRNNMYP